MIWWVSILSVSAHCHIGEVWIGRSRSILNKTIVLCYFRDFYVLFKNLTNLKIFRIKIGQGKVQETGVSFIGTFYHHIDKSRNKIWRKCYDKGLKSYELDNIYTIYQILDLVTTFLFDIRNSYTWNNSNTTQNRHDIKPNANILHSTGNWPTIVFQKFLRVKTHLQNVVQQREERCQRKRHHKNRHKSVLDNYKIIYNFLDKNG